MMCRNDKNYNSSVTLRRKMRVHSNNLETNFISTPQKKTTHWSLHTTPGYAGSSLLLLPPLYTVIVRGFLMDCPVEPSFCDHRAYTKRVEEGERKGMNCYVNRAMSKAKRGLRRGYQKECATIVVSLSIYCRWGKH